MPGRRIPAEAARSRPWARCHRRARALLEQACARAAHEPPRRPDGSQQSRAAAAKASAPQTSCVPARGLAPVRRQSSAGECARAATGERRDAHRPADLVGGDAHGVHVIELQGNAPKCLHGIGVHERTSGMRHAGDLVNGLDDARLVVGAHERHERGFAVHELLRPLGVDHARRGWAAQAHLEAPARRHGATSSTESCSMAESTTLVRLRSRSRMPSARPRSARLLDSVPPEVKTTSCGR